MQLLLVALAVEVNEAVFPPLPSHDQKIAYCKIGLFLIGHVNEFLYLDLDAFQYLKANSHLICVSKFLLTGLFVCQSTVLLLR